MAYTLCRKLKTPVMRRILWFGADLLVAMLVIGFSCFFVLATLSGVQGRPIDGPLEICAAVAFALVILVSLAIRWAVAWTPSDTDPTSTPLGRLYRLPMVNIVVAYYRLRTGQGLREPVRKPRFPWADKKDQQAQQVGDGDA